jgi:ketosteroid isomerase-like protein
MSSHESAPERLRLSAPYAPLENGVERAARTHRFHERRGGGIDGRELSAHVAAFLQIRDERIYRHETYGCYATSRSF